MSVAERRWAGSWLSGTTPARTESEYPGQRLGLPESGPGSVAGVGRRLGALVIDWLLCEAIAWGVFHDQYLTIVVFAAEVFNSALESLARAVTDKTDPHIRDALDIAAGAVLTASLGSVAVGLVLFGHRAGKMLGLW